VKGSFRIAGSHGMIDTLNPGDAWTEDRRFICEVGIRANSGRLSLGAGRPARTAALAALKSRFPKTPAR
jgi:hypothetical protein